MLTATALLALGCAAAERDAVVAATDSEPTTTAAPDTPAPTVDAGPAGNPEPEDEATHTGVDLLGRPPVEQREWTSQYDHHFRKYSKRFFGVGFDWRWFKAQGIAESSLQEDAKSWVGAKGIMQIMPATLEEIAEKSSLPVLGTTDPGHNIAAGVFYDRHLYDLWDDIPDAHERLAFTFASYNGGRSRMLRAQDRCAAECTVWEQVTPYAPDETSGYVARIMSLMGREQP